MIEQLREVLDKGQRSYEAIGQAYDASYTDPEVLLGALGVIEALLEVIDWTIDQAEEDHRWNH